ncbi:hypothetical protein Ndes2437A_g00058 [Nannochloris sp. 'desiccata']|nr:hypothetical protein KSW81_002391 [Chlorella desiccata (nom. nud.)]
MRSLLNEWEPWLAPDLEEESHLFDGGQTTLAAQNRSSGPLPLILGAGIAFGIVSFLALLVFLIRASFRCIPNQNQAALLPEQRQGTASSDNGRRGAGGRGGNSIPARPSSPSDNKDKAPPRVPVVIIEPDSTVEVAYSVDREPESPAVPEGTGARPSQRVPLWRTPTI